MCVLAFLTQKQRNGEPCDDDYAVFEDVICLSLVADSCVAGAFSQGSRTMTQSSEIFMSYWLFWGALFFLHGNTCLIYIE